MPQIRFGRTPRSYHFQACKENEAQSPMFIIFVSETICASDWMPVRIAIIHRGKDFTIF